VPVPASPITHTRVGFVVKHLVVAKVRGFFEEFSGSITFAENPLESTASLDIKAASINTGEKNRDDHLRTGDFLLVEEHPELTFRSKKISKRGDGYDVTGDLTIHGVTKEVTLPVAHMGKAKDPWGGDRLGFEAETTLNRKDFGLNWNAMLEAGGFLVGDEVKVSIEIQAVGQ